MSFKNLRSPATNAVQTAAEKVISTFPAVDDPTVNGERLEQSSDGDAPILWPAPKTLPEGRPPMKLTK